MSIIRKTISLPVEVFNAAEAKRARCRMDFSSYVSLAVYKLNHADSAEVKDLAAIWPGLERKVKYGREG